MDSRLADLAGLLGGYAIGSVPVGVLVGRLSRDVDVREHGSGSMGTTNVFRIVGPGAAALTFALDVGKGATAVTLARGLGASEAGAAAAGLAAVIGHSWPALARFRGGKGVATAFGALLLVTPTGSLYAIVIGCTALALTRIVSIGSLAAAGGATLGGVVEQLATGRRVPLGFALGATALVLWRHRANLTRLARGTEPRLGEHNTES